jgi:hypothetical protein
MWQDVAMATAALPGVATEMTGEDLRQEVAWGVPSVLLAGGPEVANGRTMEDKHTIRAAATVAQIWCMDRLIRASRSSW